MATLITGDLATDTINQSQRVIDMETKIAELEPNAAPLVVLLKKLKRVKAISPKVEHLEDELLPRYGLLTASATDSATTIAVDTAIFRVGDVLRVPSTGEALEVTIVSGLTLTVTRSLGEASALSAASGAEVFIVSNLNAEGASLRTIKTVKLVNQYNYCEIVRTPFGVTGTEAASSLYGGPDRDRLRAKFGIEHMRDWEHICFFGARSENLDTSGAPKRTAGGLMEFIQTNVVNGASLDEDAWQEFLLTGFRYGSERKVFFASPKTISIIEGFARDNIRVNDRAETYGVTMKTYVSGQGTVDLVMERAWNDSTTYGGYGFLIDMDNIEWHYLRDTKLLENRQANDADKMEDEYLTEATPLVKLEKTHSLLTGVT